jgi:hypothetical protein
MTKYLSISLKILCLIVFALYLFFLFYRPLEIEDIWWHLKTGEWISQHHKIPILDPFPFNPDGELLPFTQMYSQWLGSFTFYKIYEYFNIAGLKLFRLLIFSLNFILLFLYARKKVPFYILICLIALTTHAFLSRFLMRPFLFNFLFIQFFLIIIFSYEKRLSWKKLALLLPLGALWSNLHLGSFVYGTTIFTILILHNIISYYQADCHTSARNIYFKKTKELILFLILYWSMFSINPNGFSALLHNWKIFLDPNYIHFSILSNTIAELRSAGNILSVSFFWLDIILAINLFQILRLKEKKFLFILFYIFSVFSYLYAQRNADFLIIIQFYIFVETAEISSFYKKWDNLKFKKILNTALCICYLCHLALEINNKSHAYVYQNHTAILYNRLDIAPNNPQQAFDFLKKNKISGPIFNYDMLGGYFLWAGYPSLRPFADGRQINIEQYINYNNLLFANPIQHWDKVQSKFNFSAIILANDQLEIYNLIKYFRKKKSWKLVYLKDGYIIFINTRTIKNKNLCFKDINKMLLRTELTKKEASELKNILSKNKKNNFISSLFRKRFIYIDLLATAILFYDLGYYHASAKKLISATKIIPQDGPFPETMRMLAFALLSKVGESSK